ncbi:DUF3857 domain-containing protein [Hymenobacter sp. BT186]|uniref:DUF3857 domain-containing protein n=1 Tax=Hymenobacter telluris TaxID=2816474 RepID=A0A939JC41_9BACT|nr:DUF3857 domain-containing protein [Hymenobacter telluris]MBO0357418.1 DUF3857 domain-containing protein [Hymenobacter telluris]MBW3373444.1 DUF3857 domain-containing protein [Hymenobacter norwichensis]
MVLSVIRRWQVLLFCLLLAGPLAAQKAPVMPIRFGSVVPADFANAPAATDTTTAAAEYLCDFGTTKIIGAKDHFQVVFERTARLRINRKAGYEYATVRVPLYFKDGSAERFTNLKGFTYNFQDSKIAQVKLNPDPVFREKVDKNHVQVSFTMPNVREGSIVEFSYTITSDFIFNLQEWRFEHSIPVRWSEYRVAIPQFYRYKTVTRGYRPFAVQESTTIPYSTAYNMSSENHMAPSQDALLTGVALQLRWVMKEVPAFRSEPFMTTPYDYVRSVHFELAGSDFTGNNYHDLSGKWETLWKALQQDEEFGKALTASAPLAAQAKALQLKYPVPAARAAAVLALVQRSVRYNGQQRVYASQSLRHTFEKHSGNSADVNLLLVQTLREAGLPATPLLLSTRDHGQVQTSMPVITQFNYVVAHLTLPDKPAVFLDATEPQLPMGYLPERCLNGEGCLANADGTWLPLKPTASHLELRTARLQLTPKGQLEGTAKLEYSGYAAVKASRQIRESSSGEYLGRVRNRWLDWQPTNMKLLADDSTHNSVAVELGISLSADNPDAALFYLPLLKVLANTSHPFQSEQRVFPVDLGMPHDYTDLVTLTLPANFKVEVPANVALALPNGGGRFLYQASQPTPETVQITTRLQLYKPIYSPDEYASLREFHQRAVAKYAEMLVVRRQ